MSSSWITSPTRSIISQLRASLPFPGSAVVLPYTSATQSEVIADSYRLSRPVIAFNIGAISEQIEDGVTGFLIEAGNSVKFAEAVRRAATMDREETLRFSANAYRKGYNMYAAEAVSDKFVKALTEIGGIAYRVICILLPTTEYDIRLINASTSDFEEVAA